MIGRKVAHYEIQEKLGSGGMGEVYRAFDISLKRYVAIKRLRPEISADPEHRRWFLQEAQNAAGLSHPCIAAIHDIIEGDGELLLVMEYVAGHTLREDRLAQCTTNEFLSVAIQCTEALSAAHQQGVIHRDIKPSNIMLTSARNIKLLDFGLACQDLTTDEETAETTFLKEHGVTAGTLAYMAPEVLRGRPADAGSDIFSLGIVFYQLLSGKHPFLDVTPPATASNILNTVPPPLCELNPKVPPPLADVVEKTLSKDREQRYLSAADLLTDLRTFAAELSWPSRGRQFLRWGTIRRRKTLWSTAALLILVLLLSTNQTVREKLWSSLRLGALPDNPTLVVLPLENQGSSKVFAAFAGGLTEVLNQRLTQLSASHSFNIVPNTLARSRGVSDSAAMGKELGANLALGGHIVEQETGVRIELVLKDRTGRILRRTFSTGPLSDPMTLELQLVERSAEILGIKLSPRERRELAEYGTPIPVAYQRYLQGLGYLVYSHEQDHETAAIESFNEAMTLDTGYGQPRTAIGEAYIALSQESGDRKYLQEALSDCTSALQLQGNIPIPYLCLGKAHLNLGDLEKAAANFERARFLSPADVNIAEQLGLVYEASGRQSDAERIYQEAIRSKPAYWRGHSNLGAFYFKQSRFSDAEKEFRQVTELAPQYYRAHSGLCGVYGELFRWQDMQKACEQSLQIREQGGAYTNLATAYFYQHRFPDAVEVARKALIFLDRDDTGSSYIDYGNLAEILYWSPGERNSTAPFFRKALAGAQNYLRRNTSDSATLGRIALYHAMLGNRDDALSTLRAGLQIAPDSGEMLFKAAVIHKQFGDTGKSLEYLKLALQKGMNANKIQIHPAFADLIASPSFLSMLGH